MKLNNISGQKLGAITLTVGLGLTGSLALGGATLFTAAPAHAYGENCGGQNPGDGETDVETTDADGKTVPGTKLSCEDGSSITIPKTVPVGGAIHVTGEKLFAKDGKTPSVFGQKFDWGDSIPLDPPTDPVTGEPAGNSPMWSMQQADKDGKLDIILDLPTDKTAQDPEDLEYPWDVDTTHTIHFLSGSMLDGDYQRGARVDFQVVKPGETDPVDPPTSSAAPTESATPSNVPSETVTENPTETATATPTESVAAPSLTIEPDLIGIDAFVDKNKGVLVRLTAQELGGKVSYKTTTPKGVQGKAAQVTVGEDGTASWNIYGLDAAEAPAYVGKYKVEVTGTDKKTYTANFEVVGDKVVGDDPKQGQHNGKSDGTDNGSSGADDSSAGGDEANAGGNTGGSLPKTGAELGALGAGIVLLVGGGAAVLLTLRRRKKN